LTIINNTEHSRFQTEINGELAFIDYRYYEGDLALVHTYVPPSLRHQGIAFALVKFALDHAKAEHLKVIPACSSVSVFIELHPEYESMVR
jgi:predicted GNAT family acetyltransferase